jgi:hypothetical protein
MTSQPPHDEPGPGPEPRRRPARDVRPDRFDWDERWRDLESGQDRQPGRPEPRAELPLPLASRSGDIAPDGAGFELQDSYGDSRRRSDSARDGSYSRSRTYGKGQAPADRELNGNGAVGGSHAPPGREHSRGVALLPKPAPGRAAEPAEQTAGEPESPGRRLPWGLFLVLAVQSCISLSLIWTNSAFGDEANYLWAGHLEVSHWFGGGPTPHFNVLSGASLVYPPLGALASSVGGLVGARILSLLFMLGATILLYSLATRLFSRRAALAAAALWAVSVSALKLGAFATYDPMATFLICLSAWLIAQASFRRRAPELAILAGLAMVIADLTAYSYAIYDLALVAFAFVMWRARLGPRRAWELQAWLAGSLATLGFAIPTVMGLWSDIVAVTFTRSGSEAEVQGYVLTAQLAWEWSGLIAILGVAGAIAGFATRADKRLRAVLAVLAGSALLVPVYQLHLQTGWALDKHMSCGIWLASMAAGYLIAKVPVPADRRGVMALAAVGAFIFPLANGWMSAYSDFETWPDATALTAIVKPLVAGAGSGLFTGTTSNWVLDYYTATSRKQWGTGPQLSLTTASLPPQDAWQAYYGQQLERSQYQYSLIALEYPVGTSAFGVAAGSPALPGSSSLRAHLATLTTENPALGTLDALAAAVESDSHYQLVGVVDYSDNLAPGSYLIWKRR